MGEHPQHELGALRVWHIPQVPGTPFTVDVPTMRAAVLVRDALADYDAFQLAHNIKGDYCNVNGIERYEHDDDYGFGWSEVDELDTAAAVSYLEKGTP